MKTLLLILCFPLFSFAQEPSGGFVPVTSVYPKPNTARYLGTAQGMADDDQALAEINALEQGFANRGYFVRLSEFHRQAKIWGTNAWQTYPFTPPVRQSPADLAVLNATGAIIPEYMWPENNDEGNGGIGPRPSIASQALIDPDFPKAEAMGFTSASVSLTVENLKTHVRLREAVTLAIQPEVLVHAAMGSGLWYTDYAKLKQAIFSQPVFVSVAIVGFDDALQSFIVINNDNPRMQNEPSFHTDISAADFAKFRGKIAPQNMEQYQTIPYQYVQDLADAKHPNFTVFQLDYYAFAKAYAQFGEKYHEVAIPFTCVNGSEPQLEDVVRAYTAARDSHQSVLPILAPEAGGHLQKLRVAHLPATFDNRTRVDAFFNGDYDSAYCNTEKRSGPGPQFNHFRAMDLSVDPILMNLAAHEGSVVSWQQYFNKMAEWLKKEN